MAMDLKRYIIDEAIPGWMPTTELRWLGMLASTVPAGRRIVELGAWCGRSTVAMALNRAKGVPMTVVDTFLYSKGYRREDIRLDWLWGDHRRYERFARVAEEQGSWYPCFMESTGLIGNLEVMRMSTRELAPQEGVSMAFIDADHHGESPLDDISLFLGDPETLIVVDDCYRHWNDVIRAVMHVRDRLGRSVILPQGIKLALIMPRTGPMLETTKEMVLECI